MNVIRPFNTRRRHLSIRKIGKIASPASRPRQVPHSSRLIRPSPSASHRSRKGAVQCSRGLRGAVMGISSRAFTRLGKRIYTVIHLCRFIHSSNYDQLDRTKRWINCGMFHQLKGVLMSTNNTLKINKLYICFIFRQHIL